MLWQRDDDGQQLQPLKWTLYVTLVTEALFSWTTKVWTLTWCEVEMYFCGLTCEDIRHYKYNEVLTSTLTEIGGTLWPLLPLTTFSCLFVTLEPFVTLRPICDPPTLVGFSQLFVMMVCKMNYIHSEGSCDWLWPTCATLIVFFWPLHSIPWHG